jgi:hypothetical protein
MKYVLLAEDKFDVVRTQHFMANVKRRERRREKKKLSSESE